MFYCTYLVVKTDGKPRHKDLKYKIIHGELIRGRDFLDIWHKFRGSRNPDNPFVDQPGCYVILINPTVNGKYSEVYVGQSSRLYSRVKNHLTGHGNADVYADFREGKDVRVCFIPCDIKEMNRKEKQLIEEFNATESYNKTKGGGLRR